MESTSTLLYRAGRLLSAACHIEAASAMYLEPALRLLPLAWVGPAADHLEEQLSATRISIAELASRLRRDAAYLRAEVAGTSIEVESVVGVV